MKRHGSCATSDNVARMSDLVASITVGGSEGPWGSGEQPLNFAKLSKGVLPCKGGYGFLGVGSMIFHYFPLV